MKKKLTPDPTAHAFHDLFDKAATNQIPRFIRLQKLSIIIGMGVFVHVAF